MIQERATKRESPAPLGAAEIQRESLEDVLRGRAIELWSTAAGRLLLVADEEDARPAIERFGAKRGEIYTSAEARRTITVDDPSGVAGIHDRKRRFDAVVRDGPRAY